MKQSTNKSKNWVNLIMTCSLYLGAIFLFVSHLKFSFNSRSNTEAHHNYINLIIDDLKEASPQTNHGKIENLKKSIAVVSRENDQMIGLNFISIIVTTLLFGSFLAVFLDDRDKTIVEMMELPLITDINNPKEVKDLVGQFRYPVLQLGENDQIEWMNNEAQRVIATTDRLKQLLEIARTSATGSVITRFNFTSYDVQRFDKWIQFVPLNNEDSEFNQIINKRKQDSVGLAKKQLQPQFSQVVADLLVELNFVFQASKTLIEIEPSDTLLLVQAKEIKPYLKSFILSIHQLIKDSKNANFINVSTFEIDERAVLTVRIDKLNLSQNLNGNGALNENIKEIFSKFEEVEGFLSSRYCTISMRQSVSNKTPSCEFILSFENIPTLTNFNFEQQTLTAS